MILQKKKLFLKCTSWLSACNPKETIYMAQITFDPRNPDDIALVQQLLGGTAPAPTVTPDAPAPDPTPVTNAEPATTYEPDTTDIHGMVWDDEIHSTPPTMNSDGSWRARRGRKDEYEAAIAAHKTDTTSDAGDMLATSMPTMPSMPAAPAPTTPAAPVEYETMAKRFIAMMQAGTVDNFEKVYADLSVAYDDLETNQTSIERLWAYMDALDGGADHAAAAHAALS